MLDISLWPEAIWTLLGVGVGGVISGGFQVWSIRSQASQRRQDVKDDLDRRTLEDLITALINVKISLDQIATRLHTFADHPDPKFNGKSVPIEDIQRFRIAIIQLERAQCVIKNDDLANKVTWAIRGANNALALFPVYDFNSVSKPYNNEVARINDTILWARMLLHDREDQVDWNHRLSVRTTMLDEGPLFELSKQPGFRVDFPNRSKDELPGSEG